MKIGDCMNKFCQTLESNLALLEEQERKKVVNRYRHQIEELVSSGKSEKEAIQSLGTVSSITKKVYAEYHINAKYYSSKKESRPRLEDYLHRCAEFLADAFDSFVQHIASASQEHSLVSFFEVILKVVVWFFLVLLSKIPFILAQDLGEAALKLVFNPFHHVLSGVWEFILSVIYLLWCIFLGISLLHPTNSSTEKTPTKEEENHPKKTSPTSSYTYILLEAFLYIIAVIPLILLAIVFLILMGIACFLLYKGVNIFGLAIALLGYASISLLLVRYLLDAMHNHHKHHRLSFIVCLLILVIGHVLCVHDFLQFQYPNDIRKSHVPTTSEQTRVTVGESLTIHNLNGEIKEVVDSNLKEDELVIECIYYDEFYDVILDDLDQTYLTIYTKKDQAEWKDISYLYSYAIMDLVDNQIYNYEKLSNVQIIIYGTETTLEKVDYKKE